MFIYFLQDTLTRLYKFPDGNKSNKNAMNHIPTKLIADSQFSIFNFPFSTLKSRAVETSPLWRLKSSVSEFLTPFNIKR